MFTVRLLMGEAVGCKVTLGEVGQMLGDELGRERPYSPTSVLEWEKGVSQPGVDVLAALARVSTGAGVEVDPGWLAFGAESCAPAPVGEATALSRIVSVVRSKQSRRRGR